jgi:hypothetical protein
VVRRENTDQMKVKEHRKRTTKAVFKNERRRRRRRRKRSTNEIINITPTWNIRQVIHSQSMKQSTAHSGPYPV